ncbi:membrane protein [Rugosibacter aromaticivorans]|uniref:Membrane protein n=1 Tax=Rugosibacter aromaticivorans TaxID=1565605 RepID=A0A0C5J710_9PROT|nr:YqaA family protein [Rugosibacter aromaticivorans]AJP47439.1 membrane protein [Rugosibacter aromaticivorans]TBR15671.1 MAG: DedA family protein [Rugosibacter sp.]
MDFSFTLQFGLAGLFIAAFLSATVLPGGSELALLALIKLHPEQTEAAFVLATIGNTLGGMTTYWMARALPEPHEPHSLQRLALARRWGAPVLLLAWAPVIGDALCAAAGWLRLPWLPGALWMALGKAARYGVVIAGAGWL